MSSRHDTLIEKLADYSLASHHFSDLAYEMIQATLMDSMGCAMLALNHPLCTTLLDEPFAQGQTQAISIPGTDLTNSPIKAAFSLGAMIRWLDFNDTWLAKEWGHPSDNYAALLVCGHLYDKPLKEVLTAAIIAYEIQGRIADENSFNAHGLDHVLLVKLASSCACGRLMGLSREQQMSLISNAWVDGQSLRTYRHAPNTNERKSWAAGDASSRGLFLAWLAQKNISSIPSALTAPKWGVHECLLSSQPVTLNSNLSDYVAENILFKVSFPAEFHAQTAVEAALTLHSDLKSIDSIETIEIKTQAAGMRIISKTGPLKNPADRDHCIEYMVAMALLDGALTDESYLDKSASRPEVDKLRNMMKTVEDPAFTESYFDPNKRAIPNSVRIVYKNGESSPEIVVEYPLGHKTRRTEAMPHIYKKFTTNVGARFTKGQSSALLERWKNGELMKLSTRDFWKLWPSSF